ncbi:MAG: PorP/SprF family type IX secretion system membrane protein [Saprospiraceae bacterium]|nr:PorP/SprF family type IX secretion system membrane protein [Saprospiraceae bacterium]
MQTKHILHLLLIAPLCVAAQQLPDRSLFQETAYLWNPAITGAFPYWELTASYRQQWVGFEDAPHTAAVAVQYPLKNSNTAIGGYFMHDRINPLKVNHFTFNYAYKLKLGDRKQQQLSLGLSATMQHFLWDAVNVVVNDPDDPLLPGGDFNMFGPNASLGIYYTSDARYDSDKNAFYIGGAVQQVLPLDVVFRNNDSPANLRRATHANALIGGRIVNGSIIIEPSAWIHYAAPGIINGYLHLRAESRDAIWGGLSYSTNQTLGIQAGVVVKKGFTGDSHLRIGVAGSFNIGTFGQFRGPGYEFLAAYRFPVD